jgi:hypothetical protein
MDDDDGFTAGLYDDIVLEPWPDESEAIPELRRQADECARPSAWCEELRPAVSAAPAATVAPDPCPAPAPAPAPALLHSLSSTPGRIDVDVDVDVYSDLDGLRSFEEEIARMGAVSKAESEALWLAASASQPAQRGRSGAAGRSRQPFCKRCQRAGHWATECINEACKRLQQPAGIPSCALRADAGGGLVLPNGAVGSLVPRPNAFAAATAMYRSVTPTPEPEPEPETLTDDDAELVAYGPVRAAERAWQRALTRARARARARAQRYTGCDADVAVDADADETDEEAELAECETDDGAQRVALRAWQRALARAQRRMALGQGPGPGPGRVL